MNGKMDLTEGSLWDKVLLLALPIALMNVLQQLFNTADIAVVGRLVGNDALAAVGCAGPVVTLFITIFSGLSVGANAVIARRIGEGDETRIRESVNGAIVIALLAGVLIMIIGELITRPLLELVSTPEHVMGMAVLYLRIYFAGSIFIMLYNFESAILRAAGDTRRPLYVLLVSGIVNIALNLCFVLVCGMSVEGVALATLISNVLSAGLLFGILVREKGVLRIMPSALCLPKKTAGAILGIGIPSAVQGMLFNIANIVIQSGINSLGATVVAGSTVGLNVEIFLYYVVTGFGQACVTLNGQNLGAGKVRRCAGGTGWCLGLGFVFTALSAGFAIGCREILAGLFTTDPAVIEIAAFRIFLIAAFEELNMVIEVLSGALRGQGHSMTPASLCIFLVCGVRIVWLFFVFPLNRTFEGLLIVYPISWGLAALGIAAAYFYYQKRLERRYRARLGAAV